MTGNKIYVAIAVAFAFSGCAESSATDRVVECFAWDRQGVTDQELSVSMLKAALVDGRLSFTFGNKQGVLTYHPTPIAIMLPVGGMVRGREISLLLFTDAANEFAIARMEVMSALRSSVPSYVECHDVEGLSQPVVSY